MVGISWLLVLAMVPMCCGAHSQETQEKYCKRCSKRGNNKSEISDVKISIAIVINGQDWAITEKTNKQGEAGA